MSKTLAQALLLASVLLLIGGGSLADSPPLPSSYFGSVLVAGSPALAGTTVGARFGGADIAAAASFVEGTFGGYRLDVPGDRPDTAAVEGPVSGQSFEILVDGVVVDTAVWSEGTYTLLDLSAAAGADLRLTLDDGVAVAAAGAELQLTLGVHNEGAGTASAVVLTAALPAGASFLAASHGGTAAGETISWAPISSLAEGETAERTFSYQLPSRFAAGIVSLSTSARVKHDGSSGIDPDPADNQASDSNQLDAAPDLVLGLDGAAAGSRPGSTLIYRLTARNEGSQDATGVVLSFDLPAGSSFFSASHGGLEAGGRITFAPMPVAAGESLGRAVTVRLPSDLDPAVTSLAGAAEAWDDGGNGADLHPGDNSASDLTLVVHLPDLRVATLDSTLAVTDPQSLELSGSVAVSLENLGTLPAPSSQLVIFEDRNGDRLFNRGSDQLLGEIAQGGLGAGGAAVASVPVAGELLFRGNRLFAMIDADLAVEEQDEINNLAESSGACSSVPPPASFAPVVELSWPLPGQNPYLPDSVDSLSTPIVVQLTDDNGDGKWDGNDVADIVFVTANLAPTFPAQPDIVLRAIRGDSGAAIWNVDGLFTDPLSFLSLSGLAAGDIDNDGKPEIVASMVSLEGDNFLRAFEHNGAPKWKSAPYRTHPYPSGFSNRDNPAIADLDGDGLAEIVVGAHVFNRSGQLLWRGAGGQAYQTQQNNFTIGGAISAVADVDLDGRQEVVTGNTVYRYDGAILWQRPEQDGYPAIGNFDADPQAEIVVVAQGFLRLHDTDGSLIWGPIQLPGSDPEAGGAPTVGDFDGDGRPEIGVAGSDVFVVYETNGELRWQASTRDYSSNQTGSTIFDLDGDGAVEAIYRDERQLRIYRGTDGEVLFSHPLSSTTMTEMPVVADVDGDGNAEILVTTDRAFDYAVPSSGRTAGLRVFGDGGDGWVAARPIWNQHAFAVDLVEDDAGIPRQPAWGWLSHNTFRANLAAEGRVFASPDLTASRLEVDLGGLPDLRARVRIGNGGATKVAPGLAVAFYSGAPAPAHLLGVATLPSALAPGAFADLEADFPGLEHLTGLLQAVADDDGSGVGRHRECDENNNRHQLSYGVAALGLWITMTDGKTAVGAGSFSTYTLRVHNAFDGPATGVLVSDELPPGTTFVTASGGGVHGGGAVTWGPLTLPPGGEQVLEVTLQMTEDLPLSQTSLVNTAVVTDDGGQGPDLTPFNNLATDTNQVLSVGARAGGPYTGHEGSPVALDGSGSRDRDGTLVEHAWDLDGDGEPDDGFGATLSHTFADEGTFPILLRVRDDSGETDTAATTVTIANVAPQVVAPAALAGFEGSAIDAGAFLVTDPGADALTATVDWGDGATLPAPVFAGAVAAQHGYAEDGDYPVRVCADDGDGGSHCATAVAAVENLPPVVATATDITFSDWVREEVGGGNSSRWRVAAEPRRVTQELNGQPAFFHGALPSYGAFEIGLEVADPADDDYVGFALGFSAGETTLPAGNYLLIDWKQHDQTGARKGLALSRVKGIPTSGELWTHRDEGANGPVNAVAELQRGLHFGNTGWARGAEYLFRFESSPGRLRVFVDGRLELDYAGAVPPGVVALYSYSQAAVRFEGGRAASFLVGHEGELLDARFRFSDPGVLDVHTASIEWGDGTAGPGTVGEEAGAGEVAASHTFLDDGVFTVEACAEDDEGAADCAQVEAAIENLPPVLSLQLVSSGYVEHAVSTSGTTFTDAGVLDVHTARIDWGDGSVENVPASSAGGSGALAASHLYGAAGSYTLEVCLADGDGGEHCVTRSLVLVPRSLDLQLQKTVSPRAARPNQIVTYTLTVKNAGTLPAAGVVLTDPLPAGLSFASAPGGGSFAAGEVTFNLGTLAPGSTVSRTVTAKVATAGLPPYGTLLANTAQVADNGANGTDGHPSDNAATAVLKISDEQTPIVSIGGAFTGVEGTALVLSGVTWNDNAPSSHIGTVSWGDGSPDSHPSVNGTIGASLSAQHVYQENGTYLITICVADSGPHVGCAAATATIANRPPTVVALGEVDMHHWRGESYQNVDEPEPNWEVAADGLSVKQIQNSRPAIFHSPFSASGLRLQGVMRHTSNVDDDFLGFVLGFEPGDSTDGTADFLLIDWKQADQSFNYGCNLADKLAKRGLAVSRVSGIPSGGEWWSHDDESCNGPGNAIAELARGATLGNVAWLDNRDYTFTFEYDATHLKIWVDGVLQFDLEGNFPEGRFGFFNYSQQAVRYRGFFEGLDTRFEGETFQLSAGFGDFGSLDTHTGTADWDDGTTTELMVEESGGSGDASATHVFPDNGDYRIEACITDDDGGVGCGVFPLIVLNRPPVLTAAPDASSYPGVERFFELATLLDPGVLDSHTATVTWGDAGSLALEAEVLEDGGSGSISASHAYAAPGTYPVTVCATDDDGASACTTLSIGVLPAGPAITASKSDLLVDRDGDGRASPGDHLVYRIVIANSGGGAATAVTLTDPLPDHTTLVAGSLLPEVSIVSTDPVVLKVDRLEPGSSITLQLAVQIDNPLAAGVREIVNSGWVTTADGQSLPTDDPEQPGTSDPTRTAVFATPALALAKTASFLDLDGSGAASAGETITWTLEGRVTGNTAATGVVLRDLLPPGLELVPGSLAAAGGQVVSVAPISVMYEQLAPGQGFQVSFETRIDPALDPAIAEIANQAALFSNEADSVPSDDPATPAPADPTRVPLAVPPVPRLSVADLEVVERSGQNVAAVFLLRLDAAPAQPVSLALASQDREALGGEDYLPFAGRAEFAAGQQEVAVSVPVLGDYLPETAESFLLVFSDAQGLELPPGPATATIVDDDLTSCALETFDGELSADWRHAFVGNASLGSFGSVLSRMRLSGNGTELYHGDDNGHFAYREVSGDFRAEVDVAEIWQNAGGNSRKACLMVRSSLDVRAERAMACFLPRFSATATGLQFDARLSAGAAALELASSVQNVPLPVRFAFVRRGERLTVSYSRDGGLTWIEPKGGLGGSLTLPAGSPLLVGTMVASYQAGALFGADFDDFRACRPPVSEGPPAGEHPACEPQRPLDVHFLVDLSESMKAPLQGEPATRKIDAALRAVELLQDQLALRRDGSRTALLTLAGARDAAQNLAGSLTERVALTADSAAVAAALASLDVNDILPLATTPTGIAFEKLGDAIGAGADSHHQQVVVLLTDGVPNIDRLGRGPEAYRLDEIQNIRLRDPVGEFRTAGEVSWLGTFNGAYGTFDGEPLGNAMMAIGELARRHGELLLYGIALYGDGIEMGTFHQDLVDYAAWVTGGHAYPVADAAGRDDSVDAILTDLGCNAPGTAYLGDLVWNDLDGDGAADPGEPGLSGVRLELVAADGGVKATATTATDGTWEMRHVLPGAYTLRLVAATLPGGIVEPTFDRNGLATPAEVAFVAQAFRVRRDLDFGYRSTPPSAGGLEPTTLCEVDAFPGPDPGAAWTLTPIGNATAGAAGIGNGRLELTSNGPSLWEMDHFHFLWQPQEGDFRVEVELSSLPLDPGGSPLRKAGLMVRAGLDPASPRIMVQLLPEPSTGQGSSLQFGYRAIAGGPTQSFANLVKVVLPVRLAIERRGGVYSAFYSTDDGLTFRRPQLAGAPHAGLSLDLGAGPLAGLAVASYDPGAPMTAAFDNFASCRPNAAPAPEPPPAGECAPERPLDLVFLVDRSGSMKAPYEGVTDRWRAAQVAVEAIAAWLEDRQDGSRAALVVYGGANTPAANLAGSTRVLSGLGTDFEAVLTQLEGLESAAIAATTPTASAIALDVAGQLLRVGAAADHRPLIVWISDEPPTIDRLGRGPYAPEGQPLAIELFDGEGHFLPWGEVAWRGPFVESLRAFAGEPLASSMQVVEALKSEVPALEIHGLVLQSDGTQNPLVRTDFLDYAAHFTGGSRRSAANTSDLLHAVDLLTGQLSCQPQ